MGKGTYFKSSSDLDCVVIANSIKTLSAGQRTGNYRRKVMKKHVNQLTKDLKGESFIVNAWKQNNLHLKAVVRNDDGKTVDVDILPTADHLTIKGN